MPEVDSTALKAVDYRPMRHQLVLRFVSGETYAYDHRDAGGFIKLNALRLRGLGKRDRRAKV